MTKLSGKRRGFVQVGIHNTSRKIHLSKLKFAKTKTNMVKVGKQDTFKKYYQLNNMKNEIK